MRHYELMIILDPSLDERTVAPSLDTFLNVIRQEGGKVDKVDVWVSVVSHSRSPRMPKASTRSSTSARHPLRLQSWIASSA